LAIYKTVLIIFTLNLQTITITLDVVKWRGGDHDWLEYPSMSSLLHNDLRWLDVTERINHKLNVTVHRCLREKALRYLVDCCTPVSEVAGVAK